MTMDDKKTLIERMSRLVEDMAAIAGILATAKWRGTAVGRISSGDYIENGFALWADSYDNQSEADRAAHKAVPIQCALTLAGSLESVVITVNVRV